MRAHLLLPILLAATLAACGQSLSPNMTGTGGIPTGAGGFVTGTVGFVTGTGGTGGAITGTGGFGGSLVTSPCSALMAEYQSAFTEAETCQVGASGQCQRLVSSGLFGCSCTYVNDNSVLTAIDNEWQMNKCGLPASPCGIACPSPASYACVPTDGGSVGSCTYQAGTGGIIGTGGINETGGSSGTGGIIGTGGVPGTGGAGTGGDTGSGGIGGTGGDTGTGGAGPCDTFASEYQAVMIGARSCSSPGVIGQCTQAVPSALTPCTTCSVLVTDSSILNVIQQEWQTAGCAALAVSCPKIACPPGVTGVCVPSDAGGPVCETSPPPVLSN